MSKKDITEAAFDWETSRVHALEQSEARAWLIAKTSSAAALLAIAAVAASKVTIARRPVLGR